MGAALRAKGARHAARTGGITAARERAKEGVEGEEGEREQTGASAGGGSGGVRGADARQEDLALLEHASAQRFAAFVEHALRSSQPSPHPRSVLLATGFPHVYTLRRQPKNPRASLGSGAQAFLVSLVHFEVGKRYVRGVSLHKRATMPSVLTYAHHAHKHTHASAYSRAHTRANETGGGDDLSASFYDEQIISWCRIFPRRQVGISWGSPIHLPLILSHMRIS